MGNLDHLSSDNPSDVRVIPNDAAIHVGRLIARKIFESHGSPNSISMDVDGMAKVCALAAQTVINGAKGEWQ